MSTSGLQAAFAYVLVRRDAREALREHGRDLQTRFDLTDDELRTLQSLSPSRLDVTATTVGAKRLDFLERALPKASSVLGTCQCELAAFVEARPPFEPETGNQVNRLVAEAQRFIEYLEKDRPEGAPPYAVDLARYELLHLHLNYTASAVPPGDGAPEITDDTRLQLGRHVSLGEFAYDVVALDAAAELPKTAAPSHTFAALVKTAPRKIVPYRIGPVVFRMLESWRAPARLRDLRAALSAQLGPSVEAGIEAAARFALGEGILVIVAKD
ncbi:MAG: hypothetical protein QM820_58310 [Minicystis sp.]